MTGFSPKWLALREPYDAASRSAALVQKLARHISHKSTISVTDFGCGTGANLRRTAVSLPAHIKQRWRLLDKDCQLLAAARESLLIWADWAQEKAENSLLIQKDGREIEVTLNEADINAELETLLEPNGVVTASAFFDLASAFWIERFVKAAAQARAIIYAPLIYTGFELHSPAHPADGPTLAAFCAHQRRDKGFGPAAGPTACPLLESFLAKESYNVRKDDSSWRLDQSDGPIIAALADIAAAAIAELNLFDEAAILNWMESRKCPHRYIVGHADVLAIPLEK